MAISMLVLDASIPTLPPSIIFGVLFLITTFIHLYRLIRLRRRIYLHLFSFSALRTIVFGLRIAWLSNPNSNVLGIISGFIYSGFTFLLIFGIYDLLVNWVESVVNLETVHHQQRKKRFLLEIRMVNIMKYILPAFSVFGAVSAIQKYGSPTDSTKDGKLMRMISTLGFLFSLILYMAYITHFALAYNSTPIRQQLKALFLYMCGVLLSIEFTYRAMMIFVNATDMISRYTWMPYLFEIMPEVVLLAILGGFVLGEWFFNDDNLETMKRTRIEPSVLDASPKA